MESAKWRRSGVREGARGNYSSLLKTQEKESKRKKEGECKARIRSSADGRN